MQHASEYISEQPAFVGKLPCAKHAWSDVTDVVRTLRSSIESASDQDSFVEMEMRFRMGQHMGTHGFQPGVSLKAFEALEERFDTGRDWAKTVNWHNIHVYFHSSSVPGDARRLRTEVTFDPDDPTHPKITHTQKELIGNYDYRLVPLSVTIDTADLRIALNVEHNIQPSAVPIDVEPSAVHVKCRKCYYYAPTDRKTPVWCYMLTKRWTGSTLEDAMLAKEHHEPVCEVELECMCPDYVRSKDPGRLSINMLHKACDIFGILDRRLADRSSYMIEPTRNAMLWSREKHHH